MSVVIDDTAYWLAYTDVLYGAGAPQGLSAHGNDFSQLVIIQSAHCGCTVTVVLSRSTLGESMQNVCVWMVFCPSTQS